MPLRMSVAFCSPVPISLMAASLSPATPRGQTASMKDSKVWRGLCIFGGHALGGSSMLRRDLIAAAASLAAPAIVTRASLGQTPRKVKMGSAFTTTTNAAFLMPKILKDAGIDLELVMFPSPVQRMQAVASGDVDFGNGGLSATMQVAAKDSPLQVLANGCDGGWMVLAQPS